MIKKKNSFWTFMFSLIPGAAEMYMGLMKTGVSLMTMFFFVICIAVWLNAGPILFIAAVIWFYSFFHARNLAALEESELQQVEDRYLLLDESMLEGKNLLARYRKGIAALCIIGGLALLWDRVSYWLNDLLIAMFHCEYTYVDAVPQIAFAVIIIIFGIWLIRGKKKELED